MIFISTALLLYVLHQNWITLALAAIIVVTLKESTKAYVSAHLGDPLPKRDKRITLNPRKHIEPVGLIFMLIFGIGWGKPVMTTSLYYKNTKKDIILTNVSASLVLFLVGVFLIKLTELFSLLFSVGFIEFFLLQTAILSINLSIVNVILPVSPYDARALLNVFLRPDQQVIMASREKIMQILMIVLLIWPNSPIIGFIFGITATVIRTTLRIMGLFL